MSAHHLVAALLLFSATAAAAPVREAWLAMPDSLCPTLGATERQRMLAVAEGVYDGAVETLAGEAARIDTVAADYLRATVAGTMRIELLRLPAEGDSVLCVVKTVAGVPAGAEVVLADQQWRSVARFAPPASVPRPPAWCAPCCSRSRCNPPTKPSPSPPTCACSPATNKTAWGPHSAP